MTLATTSSVLFDAVYVPGGAPSVQELLRNGDVRVFVDEAYKHGKPIAAAAEGVDLVTAPAIGHMDAPQLAQHGIVDGQSGDLQNVIGRFLPAIGRHRFRGRPNVQCVAA